MASVVFRAAENGFLAEAAMPIRGYVRKSPSLSVASSFGTMVLWLRSPRSLDLLANLGKLRPIRESPGTSSPGAHCSAAFVNGEQTLGRVVSD